MGFIQIPKVEETNTCTSLARNSQTDNELLAILNKVALITACITFAYAISSFFIKSDQINFYIGASAGCLFSGVHLFYRYRKIEALKLYFSLAMPAWICVDTICVGGDFSQSAAYIILIALNYVFYENREPYQRALVAYVLVMFTISSLVVRYFGPLVRPIDQPFDELIVMYLGVIWVYNIFGRRDREKQRLFEELEQKNQSLLETTQELQRFTNIASHDLKSPLRNISSFIGLIERDIKRGKTDDLLDNLNFAKKGAQQMHHLIQGILEVSNVNQDAFPSKGVFNLGQLMEIAVANLTLEIAEKNAVVQYGELPDYFCNEAEMTLLFQNLIQNGIKYNTSPQPTINIAFEKTGDQLKLTFTDNGIGIEPKYHGYVFEHFKRLHNSQEYMGTGLGLPLCRKIVQKHKGEIQLISDFGKGSQFIVSLPNLQV